MRKPTGVFTINREDTILKFKRGELAYKETLLGGCTSTEECKQVPLKWIYAECLNGCRNLVVQLPKLDRVILAQSKMVNSLDEASPEYRAEKEDLDVLIAARESFTIKSEQELT